MLKCPCCFPKRLNLWLSHQQWMKVPFFPHSCQYWHFFSYFWYVPISLVWGDFSLLFWSVFPWWYVMQSTFSCIYLLSVYLPKVNFHLSLFWMGLIVFFLNFKRYLSRLFALWQISGGKTLSPSLWGCLFILATISFAARNFLFFMKCSLRNAVHYEKKWKIMGKKSIWYKWKEVYFATLSIH